MPADDPSLARAFDRAWARALMREAARRQADAARHRGPAAVRRVELLRLRFHDGLPIRDVARLWWAEPARLHHEYATARREFLAALREVVAFHHPGPPGDVDRACAELIQLLGCFFPRIHPRNRVPGRSPVDGRRPTDGPMPALDPLTDPGDAALAAAFGPDPAAAGPERG